MQLELNFSGDDSLESDYCTFLDQKVPVEYRGPYDRVILAGISAFAARYQELLSRTLEPEPEDVLHLQFINLPEERFEGILSEGVRFDGTVDLSAVGHADELLLMLRTVFARIVGQDVLRFLLRSDEGKAIGQEALWGIQLAIVGARVGDDAITAFPIDVAELGLDAPERVSRRIRQAVSRYWFDPTFRFQSGEMEVSF